MNKQENTQRKENMVIVLEEYPREMQKLAEACSRTCYTAEEQLVFKQGNYLDILKTIRKSGHLSTLMNLSLTFRLENVPVALFTFVLHIYAEFYNSSQRSGRYSKMYDEFQPEAIEAFLDVLQTDQKGKDAILAWCRKSKDVYDAYIGPCTEATLAQLQRERPNKEHKTAEAAKIAQEQLRNILSIIFPSAAYFTINLTQLLGYYQSAWNPLMRNCVGTMKDLVLEKAPSLDFLFPDSFGEDWNIPSPSEKSGKLSYESFVDEVQVATFGRTNELIMPTKQEMHPINTLVNHPKFAPNQKISMGARIRSATVIFAQLERHRTLRPSDWQFTGNLYIPPIVAEVVPKEVLQNLLDEFWALPVNDDTRSMLAPNGLEIEWYFTGNANAWLHFMLERTCWCAQEQSYAIACKLANGFVAQNKQIFTQSMFVPTCCQENGSCGQAGRYCGRNINPQIPFTSRKV